MTTADTAPTRLDLTPAIPPPAALWGPVRNWIWVAVTLLILDAIPEYFVQYWFNSSLGFRGIFLTNITAQAMLFFGYGGLVYALLQAPIRLHATSPGLRRASVHVSLWIAIFAGWRAAQHYLAALLAWNGVAFGRTDPVFGHDIGFYVYWLPVLNTALEGAAWALGLSMAATVIARFDTLRRQGILKRPDVPLPARAALFLTPYMRRLWDAEGLVVAGFLFLMRYDLLFADNRDAGVRSGAQYIDVTGVFSTLQYIHVSIGVELALCFLLARWMKSVYERHAAALDAPADRAGSEFRAPGRRLRFETAAVALLALDLLFYAAVVVRNHVFVKPNEPHIQLPYIQRHVDATLEGYRLDRVKVVPWNLDGPPLSPRELLASKTVENAPLLPSWVSQLESPPDVQHLQRLSLSDSLTVYGPMLDIFNQQQSLRPYYRFTGVDAVRYRVNGEKRMFVSAVRELPSLAFLGPKEWLRYWGSAALMFTHGYGLVMSPANRIDDVGNPLYVSEGVPPRTSDATFAHEPRIYFGEGAKDDYVLTNVRGLKEFDHATAQFRQDFAMPSDLRAGIHIDSLLKRLMFAFSTRDLTAFLFSSYIDHDATRVHIRRTPILRARSIAPFLFLDSNTYAAVVDGRVVWMINALATSDKYPYAYREVLGDKADERAVHPFPERTVNYAEDAVKITMDAYSGEIVFYQMTDDPIVSSWARVYPHLFRRGSTMPAAARAQITYPLQWFHLQFDDIYKRYHQTDPIQFYNVEDLWDDADEVLGSLGRGLKGFGSTDQSTFSYEGHPMLIDPGDLPGTAGIGSPGDPEYCLAMPFTPEGQRNLRALIVAFQDPDHYGEILSLQVPQGRFVPGPEQIESYIDNDRPVHQQVTMWMRHGSEVIRGHMTVLPVKGDLLYVETIWVNSTQNELPQLKLVAVRYRGRIASGPTLKEAIENLAGGSADHTVLLQADHR